MRKGPLCLMWVTLSIMAPAHGEEITDGGSSTPFSLSAGSQITSCSSASRPASNNEKN